MCAGKETVDADAAGALAKEKRDSGTSNNEVDDNKQNDGFSSRFGEFPRHFYINNTDEEAVAAARKTELCPTYSGRYPCHAALAIRRAVFQRDSPPVVRHVCTRLYVARVRCICVTERNERKYIRSTIVIDWSGTSLSMRRIFSRVIFKSLLTQARAGSSIQCQLEFIDFTFAKLCQRMIVFHAAWYRKVNTNWGDISDKRLRSCIRLQYREIYIFIKFIISFMKMCMFLQKQSF